MSSNPYNTPQTMPTAASYSTTAPPSNTLALVSMILGIAGIILNCCCWPLSVALGIAAIITGIIGLNKVKNGTGSGKGMALAGLICGIVGIVLGIAMVVFSLLVDQNMPDIMEQIQQMQQQNGT